MTIDVIITKHQKETYGHPINSHYDQPYLIHPTLSIITYLLSAGDGGRKKRVETELMERQRRKGEAIRARRMDQMNQHRKREQQEEAELRALNQHNGGDGGEGGEGTGTGSDSGGSGSGEGGDGEGGLAAARQRAMEGYLGGGVGGEGGVGGGSSPGAEAKRRAMRDRTRALAQVL